MSRDRVVKVYSTNEFPQLHNYEISLIREKRPVHVKTITGEGLMLALPQYLSAAIENGEYNGNVRIILSPRHFHLGVENIEKVVREMIISNIKFYRAFNVNEECIAEVINFLNTCLNKRYIDPCIYYKRPTIHFALYGNVALRLQYPHLHGEPKKQVLIENDEEIIHHFNLIHDLLCSRSRMFPSGETIDIPSAKQKFYEEFIAKELNEITKPSFVKEFDAQRLSGIEESRKILECYFSILFEIFKNYLRRKEIKEHEFIRRECFKLLSFYMKYNYPANLERLIKKCEVQLKEEAINKIHFIKEYVEKFLKAGHYENIEKGEEEAKHIIDKIDEQSVLIETIAARKAKKEGREEPMDEDIRYAEKAVAKTIL